MLKRYVLAGLFLVFFAINLKAEDSLNEGMNSDRLFINKNHVYVISSFDELDYFSVYSDSGKLVWEVPFNSKIVSWKMTDELLIIFSRHRAGLVYYVTCVDPISGKLNWEKPIFSPKLSENQSMME